MRDGHLQNQCESKWWDDLYVKVNKKASFWEGNNNALKIMVIINYDRGNYFRDNEVYVFGSTFIIESHRAQQ